MPLAARPPNVAIVAISEVTVSTMFGMVDPLSPLGLTGPSSFLASQAGNACHPTSLPRTVWVRCWMQAGYEVTLLSPIGKCIPADVG
jgi:hypothetical protein